jgi:hypothetical protein
MSEEFPRLTDRNFRQTSPADVGYNCVAWSAGDTTRWWQPGIYWPVPTARDNYSVGALEQAFRSMGYEECPDESLEPGFEKVALYGFGFLYTHAARQMPSGKWTSKLGKAEDIEHDAPDDVAGGLYGEVVQFMRRRVRDDQL